jgi:hypothetical protein
MLKDDRLVNPNSPYYQKEELYALHSFAYYNCFKCKQAYFGGRRNCEQNQVTKMRDWLVFDEWFGFECRWKIATHQKWCVLIVETCQKWIAASPKIMQSFTSGNADFAAQLVSCFFVCSKVFVVGFNFVSAIWFCWGTTHFCEPCHQKGKENVLFFFNCCC